MLLIVNIQSAALSVNISQSADRQKHSETIKYCYFKRNGSKMVRNQVTMRGQVKMAPHLSVSHGVFS